MWWEAAIAAGNVTVDEFGHHTENDTLREMIAAEIARDGAVTFCRFMELALYHPEQGYYAAREEVIGRRGDYLTSPELSPLFGAMIGRQSAEVWRLLGRPDPFTIVEAGPGNGTMARDLLRWAARAEPDLRAALRYVLVERSPAHVTRQQRLLAAEPGVRWAEMVPSGVVGCIVSNELLDAFPVHLVTMAGGRLLEAYIVETGGGFFERWEVPATPEIAAYFDALGRMPAEDGRAEVNLGAPRWMSETAQALDRGLILTLDYGYPAAKLYARWRRQGTLMTFYRHTAGDDPLARVGHQDITAHIDFTTIARAGLEAGLTLAGFTSQRELLTALGIHDALRAGEGAPGEEHFARYRAITDLLEPAGLGRVHALALTRGLDGVTLRGFAGAPDPAETLFEQ
jgi:SAM-dependent MidA family methyltransferase